MENDDIEDLMVAFCFGIAVVSVMKFLIALTLFCSFPSTTTDVQVKKPEYFYLKTVGPYWQSYGPHDKPDESGKFLEELLNETETKELK